MFSSLSSLFEILIEISLIITALCIIVSTFTEIIGSFFNLRGIVLKQSLKKRIGEGLTKSFYKHAIVAKLNEFNFCFFTPFEIKKETFQYVILDILDGDIQGKKKDAIINQIRTQIIALDEESIREMLISFLDHSNDDLESFKTKVGNWFDEISIRTTAIYSRNMKLVGFILTLIIAIPLSIDIPAQIKDQLVEKVKAEKYRKGNLYSQKMINDVLIDVNESIVLDSNIDYNENKELVFSKIDLAINKFSNQLNSICQLPADIDSLILLHKEDVLKQLKNQKINYETTSGSSYPKTLLTGIKTIADKYSYERIVSCNDLNQTIAKQLEKERIWPFLDFRIYPVIYFISLALLVSIGSETWFKFLERFINIRTQIKSSR